MDVAAALKSLQVDRKVGPVSKACTMAVSDHMSAHKFVVQKPLYSFLDGLRTYR